MHIKICHGGTQWSVGPRRLKLLLDANESACNKRKTSIDQDRVVETRELAEPIIDDRATLFLVGEHDLQ